MLSSVGEWLGELPPAGVAVLLVLVVVQLSLQVYDLVDLYRRESVPHGKWLWVGVIVLGNLLGAVAYLALARTGGVATESAVPANGRRDSALDTLYGEPGREE